MISRGFRHSPIEVGPLSRVGEGSKARRGVLAGMNISLSYGGRKKSVTHRS